MCNLISLWLIGCCDIKIHKEVYMETESTENVQNQGKKGGKDKKKKGPLIVSLIIILILLAIIAWLLWPKDEKRNVVVTKDNVDQVVKEMNESEFVAPGYYTVTMTNEWHFADGTSISEDAYVENKEKNTNDVFFDVVLADDESHTIYKSPVIPRGAKLESIALDEDLEPGTYDCVCIYNLIDEEQNTESTLRVTLKVIVEG
jgi:hypothetical protein